MQVVIVGQLVEPVERAWEVLAAAVESAVLGARHQKYLLVP